MCITNKTKAYISSTEVIPVLHSLNTRLTDNSEVIGTIIPEVILTNCQYEFLFLNYYDGKSHTLPDAEARFFKKCAIEGGSRGAAARPRRPSRRTYRIVWLRGSVSTYI